MTSNMALGVSVLALLVAFGTSTLSQAQGQELPVGEVAPKIFVHTGQIALIRRAITTARICTACRGSPPGSTP